MDQKDLVDHIDDELPGGDGSLTKQKVLQRATNIRESGPYILFDIERHPGAGLRGYDQPQIVIQTWRYDTRADKLCEVLRFHPRYIDTLEQTDVGEPICPLCSGSLDRGDLFGWVWCCRACNAVGGKEQEIFNPSAGESVIEKADFKEIDDGVWVPFKKQ